MSSDSQKSNRIIKNTILLYGRTLVAMLIGLYTSRVILNVLGIEDYGIYNVVAGFVFMFTLISGTLTHASQRFITFELGKKEDNKSQEVFSAAIFIHFILVFLVLLLGETIGLWFLNYKLNIDPERIVAANWVYQCSLFVFSLNILSIPYSATIIAHERFNIYAYVSILESILKLAIVFLLQWILFDKLIVYAILTLCVASIIRIIYVVYCKRNFKECHFTFNKDKTLYMKIGSFAGWSFIGSFAGVFNNQGVNILLNLFFGVTVNAARGITTQVEGVVANFINSFMTAINPQITKSYAEGDYKYMITLVEQGARFSFYLLLLLSVPIFFEIDFILKLWLKIFPEYTVIFVRLTLIYLLCQSLSNTLITAMFATGKIRNYQLVVGFLHILNFPLSYLFLKLGYAPEVTIQIAIVLSVVCLFARIYMLSKIVPISITDYIKKIILNVIIVAGLSIIFPILFYSLLDQGVNRLLLVVMFSLLNTGGVIYFVGLSRQERKMLSLKVMGVISNFRK